MGGKAVVYLSLVGLCDCKWRFSLEVRKKTETAGNK